MKNNNTRTHASPRRYVHSLTERSPIVVFFFFIFCHFDSLFFYKIQCKFFFLTIIIVRNFNFCTATIANIFFLSLTNLIKTTLEHKRFFFGNQIADTLQKEKKNAKCNHEFYITLHSRIIDHYGVFSNETMAM